MHSIDHAKSTCLHYIHIILIIQLLFIANIIFMNYSSPMNKVTLPRKQQFRLLELLLAWEGSVQRKKIANAFGIAINHVTNVIREYERLHPANLKYDHRKKRYSMGDKFKARYCEGTSQEYLGMLKGQLYGMKETSLSVDILSQCAALPEPEQNVKPNILRALVTAILSEKQISMRYQSLKEGEPSSRAISPHSLVCAGHRWHARAFDHTKDEYRDFVLHRILSIEAFHGQKTEVPLDEDWLNEIALTIIPNPNASDGQQSVIASEYGMIKKAGEWKWTVSLKRCLVPYFVKHMRLDEDGKSVSENPLVLKNKTKAEPYLFRSR